MDLVIRNGRLPRPAVETPNPAAARPMSPYAVHADVAGSLQAGASRGRLDSGDFALEAALTGALVDIGVRGGVIRSIVPAGQLAGKSTRELNAKGRLVSPPFVDPHCHLDAALTAGDPRPNASGALLEGLAIWGERKERLTKEDIKERAYRALTWMIAQGVLHVRTHADVSDPTLTTVAALIELREEMREFVDIQVVAFPQDGIYSREDGEELMEEAIAMGVDAVGAVPHNELTREDGVASVEYVMGLAAEADLLVDIHCDETDDDHSRFIETVAAQTIKRGLTGKVTASHATAMHSYNNAYAFKLVRLLARAGVHVVTNPFDNAILQARGDSYPKRRGITRVDELLAAGVTVGIGHDSIMDPWYPLGRGSMLQAANLLLHLAQLSGAAQILDVYRMATYHAARILQLGPDYGVTEGSPANLIIVNALDEAEALRLVPETLYVIRRGRILAQTEPALSTVELSNGKELVDFVPPAPSRKE